MLLFDSHCHLQDDRIVDEVATIVDRALAAGVVRMVCCGSTEDDWHTVLALADRFPCIIPALGIHPWYCADRSEQWSKSLEALLERDHRIAVGEIGLDHGLTKGNDIDQMRLFYEQLKLARKLNRPVSIHCRKAWGSLMELFRREPGVAVHSLIHSYSGPVELVGELTRYGASVSFSGSITYEKNKRGREALAAVPPGNLLIETDSPDISPADHSGNNEPATLVRVVQTVAALRGVDVEEIAAVTYTNGDRLFCR